MSLESVEALERAEMKKNLFSSTGIDPEKPKSGKTRIHVIWDYVQERKREGNSSQR
jgi:hypothetical protein